MKIKRFVADDLPAAVAELRREMGRDAVLLSSRRLPRRGWRWLFRRFDRIEVTGAVEGPAAPSPARLAVAAAPVAPRPAVAASLPQPVVSAAATSPPAPAVQARGIDLREPEPAALEGWRQALLAGQFTPGASGPPQAIHVQAGCRTLVALVGPTGAGKTTTLAKLAARLHLQQGWRVVLLTADTFRVGAIEQLQTYGRLLGVAVEVTPTPGALARALERLRETDVVLLDTPGRAHRDARSLAELRALVQVPREVAAAGGARCEVHLVLAAPTRGQEAAAVLSAYGPLADRLLLTKLDECEGPPAVLSTDLGRGLFLSYCSFGQRVPEDLAVAWPDRLAAGLGGVGVNGHAR